MGKAHSCKGKDTSFVTGASRPNGGSNTNTILGRRRSYGIKLKKPVLQRREETVSRMQATENLCLFLKRNKTV